MTGEKHGLTVLTRLAARCPEETARIQQILEERLDRLGKTAIEVALETEGPIGIALAAAVEHGASPELAQKLAAAIPTTTVALLETAVALERRAAEAFHYQGGGAGLARERATRLVWLARRLLAQNKLDSARTAATAAVEEARRMLNGESLLATCLQDLSAILTRLGLLAEAIQTSTEAGNLLQSLSHLDPDALLVLRANALLANSNQLSEVGRLHEALATAREAVKVIEESKQPRNRDVLASALYTVASRLEAVGSTGEAIECARRSAAIYRDLYEQEPDGFRVHLARVLSAVGVLELAESHLVESQAALEEAESFQRALVAGRPEAFASDFSNLLLHKTQLLLQKRDIVGAHAAAEEALVILRNLASITPDRYVPRLAALYYLIGTLHEASREIEFAEASYEKSALLLRDSFLKRPSGVIGQMSRTLAGYGRCVKALDRSEIPTLITFLIGHVHEILIEKKLDPQEGELVEFKVDDALFSDLFREMRAASERYPEEPAIRERASSDGFHALTIELKTADLHKADEILTALGELRERHPDSLYITEEYATALRNFAQEAMRRGARDIALSTWRKLEKLAIASPRFAKIRTDLAEATFDLIARAALQDSRDTRELFAYVRTLAAKFPEENEIRISAAKAAINFLTLELEDAEAAREAHVWLEAQTSRYPSPEIRGLLGVIKLNHLRWYVHRKDLEGAESVYQSVQTLAERFPDEQEVAATAAQALESILRAHILLGSVDEARVLFDSFCMHMPVARDSRVARAQGLQLLAYGYEMKGRRREASHCIELLLHTVTKENNDAEFGQLARELERVFKLSISLPGDSAEGPALSSDSTIT